MKFLHFFLSCFMVFGLVSCEPASEDNLPKPGQTRLDYEKTSFENIPRLDEVDFISSFKAFRKSCTKVDTQALWKEVCAKSLEVQNGEEKKFFLDNFVPYVVSATSVGLDKKVSHEEKGIMTGYYEPVIKGSREKNTQYRIPLHRVPDDLLEISLNDAYKNLLNVRLRGRLEGSRVVPYPSREQITSDPLFDCYAFLYLENSVEAFFLQVQGSGRIELPDGSMVRVGYANTNGHPYKSIGRWLIDNHYLKDNEVSKQGIEEWIRNNPDKEATLLNQNPSYVFFEEKFLENKDDGPIGAQGVSLTAGASLAADVRYYPLGNVILFQASQTNPRLQKTQIAVVQDTGGAIKGPIRFDYFWGSGSEAGEAAGRQRSDVKVWLLYPKK